MKMKKTTAAAVMGALVLVGAVTVAFATSASKPPIPAAPTPGKSVTGETVVSAGGAGQVIKMVSAAAKTAEDWGWGDWEEDMPKPDPQTGRYYTKAQYDMVAALKVSGYEKQSIAQFNRELWAKLNDGDEDGKRYEAYWAVYNEMPADDPLAAFVFYTAAASTEEYDVRLDEVYTGKRHDPEFRAEAKRAEHADVFGDQVQVGCAEINYTFTYRILDQNGLTVAARDKFLTDITAGMQAFLDGRKAEALKDEDELAEAAKAELDRLGKAGTTKAIEFTGGTVDWASADYYRD